jgi:hypothetical protein
MGAFNYQQLKIIGPLVEFNFESHLRGWLAHSVKKKEEEKANYNYTYKYKKLRNY